MFSFIFFFLASSLGQRETKFPPALLLLLLLAPPTPFTGETSSTLSSSSSKTSAKFSTRMVFVRASGPL